MYPHSNSLYASPLSQPINPFANPFALAGSIPGTMTPPFANGFQGIPYQGIQGMAPQTPTWLQGSPQQQSPLQFTPPNATLQIALQLAAQQLAQQLTGQGQHLHPAGIQQALHQLAQFHYLAAQQLAQLAAIPVQQGLFGNPYPNQFVPGGAFGPNFGAGTLH